MSFVRDFYHVEIDRIGQGKRVLKPPGGANSNIFNTSNDNDQHYSLSPRRVKNHMQSSIFSQDDDITNTPLSQQRRQNQDSDSQNRLFGPPEENSSPRKVIDRLKSNIFSDNEPITQSPNSRKYGPTRRNPLTGEEETEDDVKANGQNNEIGVDSENRYSDMKSATPEKLKARTKIPPGGVSSGIF
ncbi:microtubule-associated protein Jupiter-like [Limulus polyphemus]|uniref:Microtubule-associated protein Jupiter n=1 Tax=Limulus polyphemus TaxID=6850 RepID=A0ABM1BNP2_LIMPO|nr:microtubule-associated protein Jupiter-like [Limulus polyphemus]